jgi:guanylate kinase
MHSIQDEALEQKKRGILLVLTGPTGSGKDTVAQKILQNNSHASRITTTTTREKREGESEGNPYHFVTRQTFEQMIAHDEFFEWVEFRQELYGTTRKEFENSLSHGYATIWIIDLKGTKNIKEKVKSLTQRSVFIFLGADSVTTLEQRVVKDQNSIAAKRWNESLATWELAQFADCDYLVMNEDGKLESTVAQVQAIMQAKRLQLFASETTE